MGYTPQGCSDLDTTKVTEHEHMHVKPVVSLLA